MLKRFFKKSVLNGPMTFLDCLQNIQQWVRARSLSLSNPQPWARSLVSPPCLGFLICKIGTLGYSTDLDCCEDEVVCIKGQK